MTRSPAWAALALLLAGCATPPPPEEPWPWPVVASTDGRWQLRMGPTRWEADASAPGGFRLDTQGTVMDLEGETLLGWCRPAAAVVLPDGREVDGSGAFGPVDSRWGNFSVHGLPVEPGTARLPLLAFEVPLLRVRSWTTHTFRGLGREGAQDLPAPPFLLGVSGDEGICHVGAYSRGRGEGLAPETEALLTLLGHRWAATAAEVTDGGGRTLANCGAAGSGGFTNAMYTVGMPGGEADEDPAVAWPVTVTLRVPAEYEVETVRFEVRDLDVPPPPDLHPQAVPVVEAVDPGGFLAARPRPADVAWSEWSVPGRGLSARFSFPRRIRRGSPAFAGLALRFDAASLPPGTTHFDPWGLERGVRLLLRNPAAGASLEIAAEDPQEGPPVPPREWSMEFERAVPVAAGGAEASLRFPLASAWEELLPGEWEARLAVSVVRQRGNPPLVGSRDPEPVVWTGAFETPPVRFTVGEAAPRTLRVLVPGRLRLLWDANGPFVGCLAEDREEVPLEVRDGFTLGVRVRRDGQLATEQGGGLPCLSGRTYLNLLPGTPFTQEWDLEIYETGERWRYHVPYSERHPTWRTLWRRTLRVEATAEEVDGLAR